MTTSDLDALADELSRSIDLDRVVQTTRDLIATPSVNPFGAHPVEGRREAEIAQLYAVMLGDAGAEVELDEIVPGRPNLVATVQSSPHDARPERPSLMFAGHLDTVGVNAYDAPFDPRIADGRIHGRGSCDMKAGLAAFVEVLRVLDETGTTLGGDLLVVGTADEEDAMIGSAAFAASDPIARHSIVGEPTSLSVCRAHKGQFAMGIRTKGRAAHSSVPEQGVNAIAKMSDIIAALLPYNDELRAGPEHELCGTGSFSIGVVRGGDIVSTVPDWCEIEVDRRLLPGDDPADTVAYYQGVLDALAECDPDFTYELLPPTMTSAALDTPADAPVVRACAAAVASTLGHPAGVTAFSGCTDAPNLGGSAVILGPGSLDQAHGLDEWVRIDEIEAATQIYLRAAIDLLGVT